MTEKNGLVFSETLNVHRLPTIQDGVSGYRCFIDGVKGSWFESDIKVAQSIDQLVSTQRTVLDIMRK